MSTTLETNPAQDTANITAGGINRRGAIFKLNNANWARVCSIYADWSADATVGSRQPCLAVMDSQGNILFDVQVGGTIAASSTGAIDAAPGLPSITMTNNRSAVALPSPTLVPPGAQVAIYDLANIAASADTIFANIVTDDTAFH